MSTKKTQRYTQCTLHLHEGEEVTRIDTAWIPSEFAKKGKILKIKNTAGEWVDGWRVDFVGSTMNAEYVESHSRDHKDLEYVLEGT